MPPTSIRSGISAQARRQRRPRTRGELMTVKLRYKTPDGDTSRLLSRIQS